MIIKDKDSMTEELVRIYPAPAEIGYIADEEYLCRKGDDPHGANPFGLVLSGNWTVEVNGDPVPVYAVPITHGGPISFAAFDYAAQRGKMTVVAKSSTTVEKAKVHPENENVEFKVEENTVIFDVHKTGHYIVEINGDIKCPLFLSVNPFETDLPDPDSSDVIWFGPGLHKLDLIELHPGQTIYISGGAVLQAIPPEDREEPLIDKDWASKRVYRNLISGTGLDGVTIRGRGIIDVSMLDWHARSPVFLEGSRNIHIEGITIVGSPGWTVHLFKCYCAGIQNVKLFAHRENSDGIDIVNCENITVEDCLIRTGDDAVCIKSMTKDAVSGGRGILVQRCVVWNDKVRCFGIAGETVSDICDIVFRDCDVIHSMAVWTRELGSLCIVVGDSGTISNIRFENIRIEDEKNYAICCLIFKDRWSKEIEPGHISGITFKNIRIPEGVTSFLGGYDSQHCVSNISLDGIFIGHRSIESLDSVNIRTNSYVDNISLDKGLLPMHGVVKGR